MSSSSQVRQNFPEACEAGINKQINNELYASYVYLSMSYYFDRDDVALPGFRHFFKKSSDDERQHAETLMKYMNKRGGRIVLQDIQKPAKDDWESGLEAMKAALELEKWNNQRLLELHGVAEENGDAQMMDFLETHYLENQIEEITELASFVTNLERVGTGLGEHVFDKLTLKGEDH